MVLKSRALGSRGPKVGNGPVPSTDQGGRRHSRSRRRGRTHSGCRPQHWPGRRDVAGSDPPRCGVRHHDLPGAQALGHPGPVRAVSGFRSASESALSGRFGGKCRPHPRCIERLAQGPDGLGSGRHPHGLLGQDDRYLGVAGELELALGGQDLGLRRVGIGHRLIPRQQGQRPQTQGHDGHGDAGGQDPSAPTGVRLAAGQDVLDLHGGRCRIGQLGRSGQPVLGRPQFTSS